MPDDRLPPHLLADEPPVPSPDDYGVAAPAPPLYSHGEHSTSVDRILKRLTDEQRAGATLIDHDTLILAGPGAGKTLTLTSRLAYILCTNAAAPDQILAVTFTNNAASEMRRRAGALADMEMKPLWIGTFHGLSARLLRENADLAAIKQDFGIADEDDSLRLVKHVLLEKKYPIAGRKKQAEGTLDTPPIKPAIVAELISRWKDSAWSPDDVEDDSILEIDPERDGVNEFDYRAARAVYRRYNEALRKQGLLDFGDLILEAIKLFRDHADQMV